MKVLKYILSITVTTAFLIGCDDYLGDNVDPNKELPENVTEADLLTTAIYNSSSAHYSIALSICQYSQQLASYFEPGADTQEEVQISGGWSNIYLQALADLSQVVTIAEESGATHYLGVAKVLQAFNLGLATDQWGDVPFSSALQGEDDFKPSYDSQESIYTQINSLLDEAITLLETSDTSTIGEDDLIYNGDLSKWTKTAYFLKAKYALHLSEVNQTEAIEGVLANVSSSFSSNEDDFQLMYNERNFNPWNSGVVLPNNTGNFSVLLSDQLVSLMDGTSIPFAAVALDPRLPLITTIGDDTEYRGAINGSAGSHEIAESEEDDGVSANTDLGANNFYSSQTAPVLLGSYSELKFMEAEALFLQDGGDATSVGGSIEAYNAYLEGIEANMDKLSVLPADKATYLTDASVAVGADNLTMALIMREKFIATFLNPESFVDLRRYDFDPNVFIGLELPVGHNEILNEEWVRRAQYPASEQTRNGEQVEAVTKDIGDPVWWDRD
ncbi:SusD/RagB family nutrient-binding outer membrane lipoprotein [Zobellia roscoffensis]|uniref:SusD/RagB family nutrient-binding outer membrane lipoprotein n=1 Tax=Zobellia roscoffensis TaxID=2779508 RepID=UPI00188B443E|nr:SusD/RagB family nutrient-binding outer membrane lipoprotein [Zobellia roscoffensis]